MHHVIVFAANIGNLITDTPQSLGAKTICITVKKMRFGVRCLATVILSLLPLTYAAAMTAHEYFEDGNRLFRDELYWAALLRYEQAAEAGLDSALLHYNTGVASYRADQNARALESLQKALDSPTLRVGAQYSLGLNAYAMGDTTAALRWFRLVRDQKQNEKLAKYARIAISRIHAQNVAEYHRPDTARRALAMLSESAFESHHLLSEVRPIEEVEQALRAMMDKSALKVVIRSTP